MKRLILLIKRRSVTTLLLSASLLIPVLVIAQHQPLARVEVSKIREHSAIGTPTSSRPLTVKFSPDGTMLAIGGLTKSLKAYTIEGGTLNWSQEGQDMEPIASANLIGSSHILVSAQNKWAGGKIMLFQWSDGENFGALSPYGGGRYGVDFFSGAEAKLAWAGPEGRVFAYNLSTGQMETSTGWLHHDGNVSSAAFGPYGNLYTGGQDGRVVKNNREEAVGLIMSFSNPVSTIAVNPYIKGSSGNQIFLAASDNKGDLRVRDLVNNNEVYVMSLDSECKGLKFHTTDPDLLIAAAVRSVHFIDFRNKKIVKTISFNEPVWSMDVSLDGSMLAVALESGIARVYMMK